MSDLSSDYYLFEMYICILHITIQIYPSSHPRTEAQNWDRGEYIGILWDLIVRHLNDNKTPEIRHLLSLKCRVHIVQIY